MKKKATVYAASPLLPTPTFKMYPGASQRTAPCMHETASFRVARGLEYVQVTTACWWEDIRSHVTKKHCDSEL